MNYFQFDFQGPGFVAVPNHVAKMVKSGLLSVEALGVLVVLALRPTGSRADVGATLDDCRIGDFVWRRVSQELRAVGALRNAERSAGKFSGGFILSWPKKAKRPKDTADGSPSVGKPSVGNQRKKARKTARGKPTDGGSQVIEIVENSDVGSAKNVVPLRLQDGEAGAPLRGAAAASPVVKPPSEGDCDRPSQEVREALLRDVGYLPLLRGGGQKEA